MMLLPRFLRRKRNTPQRDILTVTLGGVVVAECYIYGVDLMFENLLDTEVARVVELGHGPEAVGVYVIRRG